MLTIITNTEKLKVRKGMFSINRNKAIALLLIDGVTQANIAKQFDLSTGRVGQICWYYKKYLNLSFDLNYEKITGFRFISKLDKALDIKTNCFANKVKSAKQAKHNAALFKSK